MTGEKSFLKNTMKIFQKLKFNIESLLNFGVYLLIFLLPLQTRYFLKQSYLGAGFWEYGSISLYLIDFIILGLFLISTIVISRKNEIVKIKKIWYLLAFFEFFVFLSIFFSPSKLLAIYGYLKILLGLSLFFILTKLKLQQEKITIAFLSGVFVQSLIGIYQHFSNYSPANKFLGMAEHSPEVLGTFVVELQNGERYLRSHGSLDHPNIYGAFILFGIIIFTKHLFDNKILIKNNIGTSFFYFFILSLFTFSLLISFSRSVYLVFLFYIIFLVFLGWKKYLNKYLLKKILLTFVFVSLLTFLFNYNLFLQRINSVSRLEKISSSERQSQVEESQHIIKNHFLFGVGVNNYTNYLKNKDSQVRDAWNYQPVHNVYYLVLAEIGIIGFLVFITVFYYLSRKFLYKRSYFALFLIFSLLLLFIFDHWMWSLHFGIIFLFFVLGLASREDGYLLNH